MSKTLYHVVFPQSEIPEATKANPTYQALLQFHDHHPADVQIHSFFVFTNDQHQLYRLTYYGLTDKGAKRYLHDMSFRTNGTVAYNLLISDTDVSTDQKPNLMKTSLTVEQALSKLK
jgi:hypothetical protein